MPVRAVQGRVGKTARARISRALRVEGHSTPAPVRGWNARDSIANMNEEDAVVLDNWFPEETAVRVRRGYQEHATGIGDPVETLMSWSSPSSSKLFAAAGENIYDVTIAGAVGAAEVDSLTSARFQHTMFGNSAGHFLYIVNGQDAPRYYDGTSWTTPTITGSGLTPSDLVHVNAFKGRLFFIEQDSLSFWYFPIETISGSISEFDLSSRCRLGGHLVAMGTWTRDGGDGMDDLAVFVTSNGEVVIFQGSDPGSANAWFLIGTFRIGAPLGRRCLIQIGADLVVITEDGFSTLSRFLQAGRASDRAAMSDRISGAVVEATRERKTFFGWQPVFHPAGNMVLVNIPGSPVQQFVSNATTGAWCRFLGMDANCWERHGDRLFFGGGDGVFEADTGLSDNEAAISTEAQTAYSYFGSRAHNKAFRWVRPVMTADGAIGVALAISTDFDPDPVETTPTFTPFEGAEWDEAEWDVADWGIGIKVTRDWQSVLGMGAAASMRLKTMSSNGTIRWQAVDWLYEQGDFI